jgi:hypothetical protein
MFKEIAANALAITCAILLLMIGEESRADAWSVKPANATMDFAISNKGCFKGNGIDPYIKKAITQRMRAARRGDAGELASFHVAVPSRPWRGLTVTGVGLHYESTSVYFREPVDTVRHVLRKTGVRIDANDSIPMTSDEAVEVQRLRPTTDDSRRYGATEVNCGV